MFDNYKESNSEEQQMNPWLREKGIFKNKSRIFCSDGSAQWTTLHS